MTAWQKPISNFISKRLILSIAFLKFPSKLPLDYEFTPNAHGSQFSGKNKPYLPSPYPPWPFLLL